MIYSREFPQVERYAKLLKTNPDLIVKALIQIGFDLLAGTEKIVVEELQKKLDEWKDSVTQKSKEDKKKGS